MTTAQYNDLRERERPIDLNDLAEMRQIVLNLATAVMGALDIMKADAGPGASAARMEDLENFLEIAVDVCRRLEPEHPLATRDGATAEV